MSSSNEVSESKRFCSACGVKCRSQRDYDSHMETAKHKKNVGQKPVYKPKTYRKSDYKVDNFIPLNLNDNACYVPQSIGGSGGLNLGMSATEAVRQFIAIFIKNHKLDYGFLPPFLLDHETDETNHFMDFLGKSGKKYIVPQIHEGEIVWVNYRSKNGNTDMMNGLFNYFHASVNLCLNHQQMLGPFECKYKTVKMSENKTITRPKLYLRVRGKDLKRKLVVKKGEESDDECEMKENASDEQETSGSDAMRQTMMNNYDKLMNGAVYYRLTFENCMSQLFQF
jgi:hypothetical protein